MKIGENSMKWFLVFTLYGSDNVLLKEMISREECLKTQKEFVRETKNSIKTIKNVTCEEGMVLQQFNTGEQDEVL